MQTTLTSAISLMFFIADPMLTGNSFFLSLAVILSSDLTRISIWWMGVSRINHLELIVQNFKLEWNMLCCRNIQVSHNKEIM